MRPVAPSQPPSPTTTTNAHPGPAMSAAWKLDPLVRLRTYLANRQWWTKSDEEKLIAEWREKVDGAVADYLAIPPPAPESMFDHLFESLPASLQWQRDRMARR